MNGREINHIAIDEVKDFDFEKFYEKILRKRETDIPTFSEYITIRNGQKNVDNTGYNG